MEMNATSGYVMNDDYFAIADGSQIYLYARDAGGGYMRFDAGASVSSMQLYESGGATYLFFVSSGLTDSVVRYAVCGENGLTDAASTAVTGCSSFAIYTTDAGTYFY